MSMLISIITILSCLINFIDLDIAIESNVTVGKWMIFRRRAIIDEVWQMIAEATVEGKLGCFSKVVNIAS